MQAAHIHRKLLIRAFSKAAATYDAHAVLQREVADRLLNHMEFTRFRPRRVLDIGCGTGYLMLKLRKRFRSAGIYGLDIAGEMLKKACASSKRRLPFGPKKGFVQGDAVSLPFRDESIDLVCSNLTLQWVADPEAMLREMRRILAPGGLILFATFGRRTLLELRQSLAEIAPERAGLVLPFPDVTSLGNSLMELPVELPVTDTDLFTLTYPDVIALVRELKGLGASSSAINNRPGGLYGRALLNKLDNIYGESHRMEDGRIRASFEVLYAQAWYAKVPFRPEGEVISIEVKHGA